MVVYSNGESSGIVGVVESTAPAPLCACRRSNSIGKGALVALGSAIRRAERDIQEKSGQDLAAEGEIGQDFLKVRAGYDLVISHSWVGGIADQEIWRIGSRRGRSHQSPSRADADELPDGYRSAHQIYIIECLIQHDLIGEPRTGEDGAGLTIGLRR